MEKLHIRKIASLGLMLCFFTGGGAQTPVKVEKRKEPAETFRTFQPILFAMNIIVSLHLPDRIHHSPDILICQCRSRRQTQTDIK